MEQDEGTLVGDGRGELASGGYCVRRWLATSTDLGWARRYDHDGWLRLLTEHSPSVGFDGDDDGVMAAMGDVDGGSGGVGQQGWRLTGDGRRRRWLGRRQAAGVALRRWQPWLPPSRLMVEHRIGAPLVAIRELSLYYYWKHLLSDSVVGTVATMVGLKLHFGQGVQLFRWLDEGRNSRSDDGANFGSDTRSHIQKHEKIISDFGELLHYVTTLKEAHLVETADWKRKHKVMKEEVSELKEAGLRRDIKASIMKKNRSVHTILICILIVVICYSAM
ncbi:hypothetical protein ACLOJK_018430 [Asimina triloba]